MKKPKTDFRKLIRDCMNQYDISAHRLSQLSGVPRTSLYEYLRGEHELSANSLAALLDTFVNLQ